MLGNLHKEILSTDIDSDYLYRFLQDAVLDVVNSNSIPEMIPSNYKWYLEVLFQELQGVRVLVVRSDSGYAACAFTTGDLDHHVLGAGMTMQCTFSTCKVCTSALMRDLKDLAQSIGLSWLKVQHRVGVHTYKSKLYMIRS